MRIYPIPRKIEYTGGQTTVCADPVFVFENFGESLERSVEIFSERCALKDIRVYTVVDYEGKLKKDISLSFDSSLSGEAYRIEITKECVSLFCGTEESAFRALTTLYVLLTENTRLECCTIADSPSVENRGYLLDISRDRVPKLETILKTVDMLSLMKYNELQMYLEQPAVEFSAFPEFARDIEGLKPSDILKIKAYCKERFISLRPNMNSFGHSHLWLLKPQLRHLATKKDGYVFNPTLDETYKFLDEAYSSLLPNFDEPFFNVGCDEVSELDGPECVTKELCEKEGTVNVYLNHLLKLHKMLKDRDKRMMIWADIAVHHPEIVEKLPKDIIPLVWGYAPDSDLETGAKLLSEKGFDFYICPSTLAYACITGFFDSSSKNIENAVKTCVKYKGKGVLVTDWGDIGSVAFPFVSLRPIMYGGAEMWCVENNVSPDLASEWADRLYFKPVSGSFSKMIDKLASKNLCTGIFSVYVINFLWEVQDTSMFDDATCKNTEEYRVLLDKLEEEIKYMRFEENGGALRDRYRSSILNMKVCIDLFYVKKDIKKYGKIKNFDKRIEKLDAEIREAKVLFRRLWAEENNITGWYGFWWFVDRQVNKIKYFVTHDERYTLIINDNKEWGI